MVNYDSQLKHYNCGEIVGNIVKKKIIDKKNKFK